MESAAAPRRLRIGEWQVDSTLDEIRAGDRLVKLEPRTMRLLCVLAERPGQVWSADELLERVWPGVMVTQSSVYQAIATLRRVLGDDGDEARYIATVPRKGYRLVAAVESLDAPSAAPAAAPQQTTDAAPHRRATDRPNRFLRPAIIAALLVVAVAAGWMLWPRQVPASVPPAVAVLPFADLSDAGKYQTFCDGLSDELLNALARVPGLRVTGRNSSFQFRGAANDAREVGRQLGVTHVIEGSVRHSGERVRVTAQLVDARTGFQVWSNNFDRPRSDALAVQTEISRAVVEALKLQLTPEAVAGIERPAAMQVNAYDLYLLGRHQQLQRNPESLARAIAYHKQAIAADPKFALAHAGLADAYMSNYYYSNQPLDATQALVQPEIDAALRLDPELAEAYAAWSVLLVELERRPEAIAALKRAIAINSNYGEAYLRLGFAYENDGQLREALSAYDQVSVLDPLNTLLHVRRCLLLTNLARFTDAKRACDRGFELQPDLPNALWATALLHLARGELDQAVGRYQAALQRAPARTDIRSELAVVYLDLDMPDDAAREIEAVRKVYPSSYLDLIEARVFFVRGDLAGMRRYVSKIKIDPAYLSEHADAAWLAVAAGDEALARRWSPREPVIAGELEPQFQPSIYDTRWSLCSMCQRATLERLQGDDENARRHVAMMRSWLDSLSAQGGDWPGLHFLRAQLAAQSGDGEAAFTSLTNAVDRGWRREWILRAEPAFAALRGDSRYSALLKRIQESNKQARDKVTQAGP
jgi:TolB-like protein/DNA-binding winged helix-turn-helix (wHTH) protein/Flp pilus assembly protein TadD